MTRILHPPKPPETEDLGQKVRAHQRYKTSDSKVVPGVTTVLSVLAKPALVGWANRLGLQGIDSRKYVDETSIIGTLAHYLVECELGQRVPNLRDFSPAQVERAERSITSFRDWRSRHELTPILVEEQLVHDRFQFGGTVDCLGLLDNVMTLLDFKTSAAIYPEHKIQTAAYCYLLLENGHEVKAVRILRIGRQPSEGFEEHVLSGSQLLTGWKLFRHCLEIYRLQKEMKG